MRVTVNKMLQESGPNVCVSAQTCDGRMTQMSAHFDWTMPSNSAHKMRFDVTADVPYWGTGLLGDVEHITCNKPLVLVEALEALAVMVEALEALAVIARSVYEEAMREAREAK